MKLLLFPHSHYCEKARWALDHKRLAFEPCAIMPGLHVITVRRYAPDTSVPVLLDAGRVIQGSSEIIDYLDSQHPAHPLTPTDSTERETCLEIERDMDRRLGENLRTVLYDYLLSYPAFIRYCFTYPMSQSRQAVFRLFYPLLRHRIHQTYVSSPARVARCRQRFDQAMESLAEHLEGRDYLVGERFSRADLSVAAMLSLLVMPDEHPFEWIPIPDAGARGLYDEYREHPACSWARRIYRDHRLPQRGD